MIGNLGYVGERGSKAQVYRLSTQSFAMERVKTTGEDPGWISDHRATLVGKRIIVTNGKEFERADESGGGDYVSRDASFALDLGSHRWSRVETQDR